jgi:hypothetical protein
MKCFSFLLIISLLLCYTGVGPKARHSSTVSNLESYHTTHHENHKQEAHGTDSMADSYKVTDATKHKVLKCCNYMLPNAPQSYNFDLVSTFLYSVVNTPALEVNKTSSFPLGIEIQRKYRPPGLFLANSSFLL